MKSETGNPFAKAQKVAVETLRLVCKRLTGLIPVMMLAFVSCDKEDDAADFCTLCREGKFDETLRTVNDTLDDLLADTDGLYDAEKLSIITNSLMQYPCIRKASVFGINSNISPEIHRFIPIPVENEDGTPTGANMYLSEIVIEFDDYMFKNNNNKFYSLPDKILQISMQEPWEVDGFIDFNYKTYSNSNSDPAKAILGKWEKIACGFNGKIDSDCKNFRPPGSYLEFLPNGTWRYYHPIGGNFMLGIYTVGKSSIVAYQVFTNCIVSYGQCETYRFFNKDKLEFKSCVPVWENDFYDDIKPNYNIYQRKN